MLASDLQRTLTFIGAFLPWQTRYMAVQHAVGSDSRRSSVAPKALRLLGCNQSVIGREKAAKLLGEAADADLTGARPNIRRAYEIDASTYESYNAPDGTPTILPATADGSTAETAVVGETTPCERRAADRLARRRRVEPRVIDDIGVTKQRPPPPSASHEWVRAPPAAERHAQRGRDHTVAQRAATSAEPQMDSRSRSWSWVRHFSFPRNEARATV